MRVFQSFRLWGLISGIATIGIASLFAVFGGGQAIHAASCELYRSGYMIPEGYGAAWNVFAATGELLLKGNCKNDGVEVTVGDGRSTTYVYKQSYYWNGSRWVGVALSGASQSGDWIIGSAQGTIPVADANVYYAAYTCRLVSGSWKCGCRDQSCAANYWQLQQYLGARSTTEDPQEIQDEDSEMDEETGEENGGEENTGTEEEEIGGTDGEGDGGEGSGVTLPPSSSSLLQQLRQQLYRNSLRSNAYLPLGKGDGNPQTVSYSMLKKIPLDGDRELNVRGGVYPIDIDGDRTYEFLHYNGFRFLRVFDDTGKKLWEITDPSGAPHRSFAHRATFGVWDFDGDGGQDVAHCWDDGREIVIRDGASGKVIRRTSIPAPGECRIATFFMEEGPSPLILVGNDNDKKEGCQGDYADYWSRTIAFDGSLRKLWDKVTCDAGHHVHPVDEDYNGKAEALFVGKYKIDGTGRTLCTLPWKTDDHVDSMQIGEVRTGRDGLEVAAVGATGAGLFSAQDCRQYWFKKGNFQSVSLADVRTQSSGAEVVLREPPYAVTPERKMYVYKGDGELVKSYATTGTEIGGPYQNTNIDASGLEEVVTDSGTVVDGNGKVLVGTGWYRNLQTLRSGESSLNFFDQWTSHPIVMNITGDARPEIVTWGRESIIIGSQ